MESLLKVVFGILQVVYISLDPGSTIFYSSHQLSSSKTSKVGFVLIFILNVCFTHLQIFLLLTHKLVASIY